MSGEDGALHLMAPAALGGWGAARTRTVTWYDPAITAEAGTTMRGLEFLRAMAAGILAPPPIAGLLGMQMREVEHGRVVFSCLPDESVYNPIGVVHGGLVCTLADTVAACAVHSTLDAGLAYTSVDLNVSYLRPVTTSSGVLEATGVVTKPGRRVAFARADIADEAGRLVATATTSCLVMERR
jgi:uncharacterized protein (TIGR00369 family)